MNPCAERNAPGLLGHLPLSTPRLVLRPFDSSDATALFRLHGDPEVMRYAGGTKTLKQSREALGRLIEKVSTTGLGAFAVQERMVNTPIGWCGIQKIPRTDDYEVTYALVREKWGNGLAFEAASSAVALAFKVLRIERVHGLVYPENYRSVLVLERLGMRALRPYFDEASQREAMLYGVSRSDYQSSSK